MRWFARCESAVSKAAVVRSRVSSLATTSPSKKSLQAAERQRVDVARARRRWIREQGLLDPGRLVFFDETAIYTKLNTLQATADRLLPLLGPGSLLLAQNVAFNTPPARERSNLQRTLLRIRRERATGLPLALSFAHGYHSGSGSTSPLTIFITLDTSRTLTVLRQKSL